MLLDLLIKGSILSSVFRSFCWTEGYLLMIFFSFCTLNMSSHCLLVCIDSDEMSAKNLTGVPFNVMAFFPFCFHDSLCCLSKIWLLYVFVLILLGIHWASEMCRLMFFNKFEKSSVIISSNIFLSLLPDIIVDTV